MSRAYVSLYPKDHAQDDEPNRSSPVWAEVEEAMAKGTLNALRDRPAERQHQPPPSASRVSLPNRKERRAQEAKARKAAERSHKRSDTGRDRDVQDEDTKMGEASEEGKVSDDDDDDDDEDGHGLSFFE